MGITWKNSAPTPGGIELETRKESQSLTPIQPYKLLYE